MPDPDLSRWARPAAILVATDLSDLDRLLPFAVQQASQTGARLFLLHVIAGAEAVSADLSGMPYYDPIGAFETVTRALESCCIEARRKNIRCDVIVREGNAARQILTAARQFSADCILLGTRGRGKLTRLVLGSVAEQVLRSVNLPVITVGPEAHREVVDSAPQRVVLHATTLSEASRPSAVLACRLASQFNAKLVLLHVLPHMEDMKRKGLPTGLDSAAMQQLRQMAAEISSSGLSVEPQVAHGNPSIEILAKASELQASLIVLGAAERSPFDNLTRDRTVYKVLAHARCPVLTLRETSTHEEGLHLAHTALHS